MPISHNQNWAHRVLFVLSMASLTKNQFLCPLQPIGVTFKMLSMPPLFCITKSKFKDVLLPSYGKFSKRWLILLELGTFDNANSITKNAYKSLTQLVVFLPIYRHQTTILMTYLLSRSNNTKKLSKNLEAHQHYNLSLQSNFPAASSKVSLNRCFTKLLKIIIQTHIKNSLHLWKNSFLWATFLISTQCWVCKYIRCNKCTPRLPWCQIWQNNG